jgi:hypothetical protein
MAFAGIFQPFARLRWIRFGLFMRSVNSGAAFPPRKQRPENCRQDMNERGQSQVLTPVLDFQSSFGWWPASSRLV